MSNVDINVDRPTDGPIFGVNVLPRLSGYLCPNLWGQRFSSNILVLMGFLS